MMIRALPGVLMAAGLLVAAPAMAQTAPNAAKSAVEKQRTDGDGPTQVGPGSQASKQRTDGDSPTQVGQASQAFKQRTDGASPSQVGPASSAYKQN